MSARSLHAWLGLALALVIAVPTLVGMGAWLTAAAWQHGRERHRQAEAMSVLRSARLDVLTNLLDNATRHGHERVTLAAQRRNGAVRVEVADDGPGFAPADLPRVFDPLFRSDRARAGVNGGTGLGLAIARRLARAHGGDVEAANDPGGGARATLTLPAAD
jgi:signal transduction histidine kinase